MTLQFLWYHVPMACLQGHVGLFLWSSDKMTKFFVKIWFVGESCVS